MVTKKCTDKELTFARVIARGGHGPEAVDTAGYSVKTAGGKRQLAYKIQQRPHVLEAIEHFKKQNMARLDLTDAGIVGRFAALAQANIKNCINPDTGEIINPKDLPEVVAFGLNSYKETQHFDKDGNHIRTVREIRLADRIKAMENLAKMANLYEKHQEAGAPKFQFNMQWSHHE